MSWIIVGDMAQQLGFSVSEVGAPTCYGNGQHECRPIGNAHTLLSRIKAARMSWSITVPTQSDVHMDGSGEGLYERVKDNPEKPHGMMKFYGANEAFAGDGLGCSIVVPQLTFVRVRHLLEVMLKIPDLEFLINVDFVGFREVAGRTETPSWHEFIDGKPLFFDTVSFTLKNKL